MIPNTVDVAGIGYEIEEVDNLERDFDHLGQILYTKGIIKVDSNIATDRKEQVFVHELLHAIFFEAGIEEQEEDMVNRVGIVLYQVLKQNKLYFGKS